MAVPKAHEGRSAWGEGPPVASFTLDVSESNHPDACGSKLSDVSHSSEEHEQVQRNKVFPFEHTQIMNPRDAVHLSNKQRDL